MMNERYEQDELTRDRRRSCGDAYSPVFCLHAWQGKNTDKTREEV
jgi:hypothetical protein